MKKLVKLSNLGQSIWLDYIKRSFILSGELQGLIDEGLRGITSNPTIFEKAIDSSNDYDEDIRTIISNKEGESKLSTKEIYERLVFHDIGLAADLMLPVYKSTNGQDGFVSIEVSPKLAHNTAATIEEGIRIFSTLNRPNIMIKVPATPEGLPAITELISNGINVNVTLMFSIENYRDVTNSYIKGLELLRDQGKQMNNVNSVASFFVSRIDTLVDAEIAKVVTARDLSLTGKIAIANSKQCYRVFKEIYKNDQWRELEKLGAKKQRLLWASTGTKNPKYPDTMYIDNLIGKDTVNTVPPATLNAYLDHGAVRISIEDDVCEAVAELNRLKNLKIDLDNITTKLQDDGVAAFAKSFDELMLALESKIQRFRKEAGLFSFNLGGYQMVYESAIQKLNKEKIIQRIWDNDYKVWGNKPDEIINRLGWLNSPEASYKAIESINEFVDSVRKDGYTYAILLGMGGSSLAPEVLSMTFGTKPGYLNLSVLDSTDPGAILEFTNKSDPSKTLYIVSTKSGGTVETFSFMKYFFNKTIEKVGMEKAGNHFIAITDPGSGLESAAKELNFRKIFLNDPNIGGRYSALSLFGIVPAALIGIDIKELLSVFSFQYSSINYTSARLGVIIGELAKHGRDKLTFLISEKISHFGDWVEQLIAESTGKIGKGVLPVHGETVLHAEYYSNDRLFVIMKLEGDYSIDKIAEGLEKAGHPVIKITLENLNSIGKEFFVWELATSIIGWNLGIQPFDQPDVESAKILARKMVEEYKQKGKLPEEKASIDENGIRIYGDVKGSTIKEVFNNFLNNFSTGEKNGMGRSYIALQAYLKPDGSITLALQSLRTELQKKFKSAVTVGYGPRFLHSTGQLHKGDAGKGLFIQFTANIPEDIAIPDNPADNRSAMSFGVLITAQSLGDRHALLDKKRKVIMINLGDDIAKGLKMLEECIGL